MPVIRIAKRDRYTTIPNPTLRDDALSLAATGLLSMMLSYPDDWQFNYTHLISMKTNGRDAFKAAMRELVAAGYVRKAPKRNADGTVEGWEWEVLDEKPTVLLENRQTVKPSDGEPAPTKTERPTKTEKNELLSAAPTLAESKTSASRETVRVLLDAWNENRGVLAAARSASGPRLQKLLAFAAQVGDIGEAVRVLTDATKNVASDDWWIRNKGKYGLDNLLAGGKVFQRAESYEAGVATEKVTGVAVGDAIEFRYRVGSVERWAPGVVRAITDAQYVVWHEGQGREFRVPHRDVRRP